MVRRKNTNPPTEPEKQPSLVRPRAAIVEKLAERIQQGRNLQDQEIASEADIDRARDDQRKWHQYNIEYLSRCFDVQSIANSYSENGGYGPMIMNASPEKRVEGFREGIGSQINQLESISERLELIPELASTEVAAAASAESRTENPNSRSVFVVHGHDESVKTQVARYLEKLELRPIILHEQPNRGQTIIEKFESNAAGVGYAIVLLTPDDIDARAKTPDEIRSRARQNVILELGYFFGALGRERVCVLYKSDVEIPSDYLGVTYIQLDDAGGWQILMAREIKASGIDIDLNLAI